ncbi:MAG: hypothetical protein GX552_04265 [Chloroflexi bacterium]|nr:hypothetical protein [Chloroflexota bacterium]
MTAVYLLGVALVGLVSVIISVLVWWKIFSKAGYSGALGLLTLIPLVNVILMLFLAFATWPVEEELRRLRESVRQNS